MKGSQESPEGCRGDEGSPTPSQPQRHPVETRKARGRAPAEFRVMRIRDCGPATWLVDTPQGVFDYWKAHVATAPWYDPSKEALDIHRAGQLLKIDVLDHVIVGTDFKSLRAMGFLG